ncbi:hypothetical protein GCM10023238_08300 [Streptomyces heliomycini]
MLSEMRTINAAKDRLDRRALHTQGGLSLLSAAVAGAGLVWGHPGGAVGRVHRRRRRHVRRLRGRCAGFPRKRRKKSVRRA